MKSETKSSVRDAEIVAGSGNIFADLNVGNPEEAQAKAELAYLIRQRLREKGWAEAEAADRLPVANGRDIALVSSGKVGDVTYERLLSLLNALNINVRIVTERAGEQNGKTLVAPVADSI